MSLALGIGANTAIFTLLDQLVLRLLPVKDPEQLVMIWTRGPHFGNNRGSRAVSYPMYQDFQQKAEAFSHVFCRYYGASSVSFAGRTERVNAELVSGNFYQALGVRAAVGRVFSPEEDDRIYKGHPVVVLSHPYWVSRFGADPHVVGQKILVNNYPMTIVGVSAAGFVGLDPADAPQIRVPILMKPVMTPGWDALDDRRSRYLQVFGRLKPGYTVESAKASLEPLFKQILRYEVTLPGFKNATQYMRDRFLEMTVNVIPAGHGYSGLRERYATALTVLMCMVGLVLLIACANVANLLIARAVARQKEIAVRLAVGASRGRLVRQLLVESLLLALAGAGLGVVLSIWTVRGLLRFLPSDGALMMLKAQPDLRILGFTVALAVLTSVFFGLAPAWRATRVDLWNTLKDVVGAVAGTGGSARLRKSLVTLQVALSFLLLSGAGLFVKSLQHLKDTKTGFHEMDNLVTFRVDASLNGYSVEREKAFYKQVLDNVRTAPGVRSAGIASYPLLHGWESDSSMGVEGHQPKDGEDMQAFMNNLSPGYFRTMGVPLLEGRDFEERDAGERFTVAIVNRKFAHHFFGDESPLGRRLGFGVRPDKLDIEIVGVVEDSLYDGPREGVRRQVFVPRFQSRFPGPVTYYVRAGMESKALFVALANQVKKLDPAMPVFEMKTLETQLDETLGTERLIAALSVAFGALATLLAAIGLYGVLAFVVARRTKEIGLRMALGAQPAAVLWLIMKEVLVLLAGGLAIGIPAAYLLSRYVAAQLYGVPPADPGTAVMATLVLSLVALSAGLAPARRASAISPIRALRYE